MTVRCPPVQRCRVCERLLIHKGERSQHESASYLGQCVHNMLPLEMTTIDVDLALYRREAPHLLRYFEHKGPQGRVKAGQDEFLRLQARIIDHLLTCEQAPRDLGFTLHPRSGVFLLRGDPHEGNQLGSHLITKLSGAGPQSDKDWLCADEFTILRWMAFLDRPEQIEYVRQKLRRRRIQPEAS